MNETPPPILPPQQTPPVHPVQPPEVAYRKRTQLAVLLILAVPASWFLFLLSLTLMWGGLNGPWAIFEWLVNAVCLCTGLIAPIGTIGFPIAAIALLASRPKLPSQQ